MYKLADIHAGSFPAAHTIAHDHGEIISWDRFLSDLAETRALVRQFARKEWALFEDDAYRFAVGLFALLAEDRSVYLPGENNPAVTRELEDLGARCLGLFPCEETLSVISGSPSKSGYVEDFSLGGEMIVFTSGSTGHAKAIQKGLQQIDAELETLEQLWGERLGRALVLSSVSHQHLYGLLFNVLWPLCAGRAFWRRRFDSPMSLMAESARASRSAWVMSPAHLHRLDHQLAWEDAGKSAVMVFSSGGLLRETAAGIVEDHLDFRPCEVLGSSETGGIAWRKQYNAAEPWTPFPGIQVDTGNEKALKIRSPFLASNDWYVTDDSAEILEDGRFSLGGRLDRIVKIEGKRVSLPATEAVLNKHPWVTEAFALPVTRRRQCVGALLSLSDEGREAYSELGHHRFGLSLRRHCLAHLAAAATPRYWRSTDQMPRNPQGKVLQEAVQALFEKGRIPTVLQQESTGNSCRLVLFIEHDSPYFEGHFPGMPILPGITQVYWAEHFAREVLDVDGVFIDMKTIKFKELVLPGSELVLNLDYAPDMGRLDFRYESAGGTHSQGRLFFGTAR